MITFIYLFFVILKFSKIGNGTDDDDEEINFHAGFVTAEILN